MRFVTHFEVHPFYNDWTLSHDVSLWHLNEPITDFNWAWLDGGANFEIGEAVRVIGWGESYDDVTTNRALQEIVIDVVECADTEMGPLPGDQFCAGRQENGVWLDSCYGDSGGPIFDVDSLAIVGLVSWGYGW